MNERTYLCIDLKSFYASVECVERNLDPLTTNLVVADENRTEKTICLAVTPSLKAYGVSGRPRLFEVVQAVKNINYDRRRKIKYKKFAGKSYNSTELSENAFLELDYIIAKPRMAQYIKYSTRIYEIYLKYVSSEDILVYSIDEVFMDITDYLSSSNTTPREFAINVIRDVLKQTGITATAGIGSNMYLAKVAMDITAKKMSSDEYGVRIAILDEMSYRKQLWGHKPISDFWRVGRGYAKKLEENHIFTMGDVARASTHSYGRQKLKKLFGINAKMLIDHAWGYEPCTLKEAKAYTPENRSISTGQVLQCPYDFDKARIIVWEMAESLSLDLVEKRLVTNQLVLMVGYDAASLSDLELVKQYNDKITIDMYGRKIPKHAHGTVNLDKVTSSTKLICDATLNLYDKITDKKLLIRRITIAACKLLPEENVANFDECEQMDFFTDYKKRDEMQKAEEERLRKERKIQEAMIEIKNKFGKNAVVKGTNLQKGATGIERNNQIGGHKA